MANYREIVTKAVIGKGKKTFTSTHSIVPDQLPNTILGCWVINHNFQGRKENDSVKKASSETRIPVEQIVAIISLSRPFAASKSAS